MFCVCTSACKEPGGRGLHLHAAGGTLIMCILSGVKLVRGDDSVSGIFHSLLIVQGWKDYLMQGKLWWREIIVAELRPQLEAVQVCLGPRMCVLGGIDTVFWLEDS